MKREFDWTSTLQVGEDVADLVQQRRFTVKRISGDGVLLATAEGGIVWQSRRELLRCFERWTPLTRPTGTRDNRR